jgi:hypothetical protein
LEKLIDFGKERRNICRVDTPVVSFRHTQARLQVFSGAAKSHFVIQNRQAINGPAVF